MRRIGRFLKRLLFYLGLVIVFLVIVYWKLVSYGVSQAVGQLKIVWQARPIAKVLADPTTPDSIATRLKLIGEIKAFAIDSLGLKNTNNYTTYYDQHNLPVMWVVTASEPYALVPKEWSFPVLGKVPYKGFFNHESAIEERDNLVKQGFDVRMQNPDAWSTLGWFTDPVMSGMLDRGEGDLASLIIHEMTHATLFVRDSVIFNENLASFIGDRGAELYMKNKYGVAGKPYLDFIHENHDDGLFIRHILRGAGKLDSLYRSFTASDPVDLRSFKKEQEIKEIVVAMDTVGFYNPGDYAGIFRTTLPNNAYFLSFRRYESQQPALERQWKEEYHEDFREFLAAYKKKYALGAAGR